MKRKVIIPIICIVILCGIAATVALWGLGGKPKLSSLSDEKFFAVLNDYGITVPEELKDINVRETVKRFEEDPDTHIVVSYEALYDFSEQVRIAVKKYYARLSELEEDEVMQMLADRGISMPEGFQWKNIQELIFYLEENPDAPGAYSYSVAQEFFEKLQELVKEYYVIY